MKSVFFFLSAIFVITMTLPSCGGKGKTAEEAAEQTASAEAVAEDVHLHYIQVAVEGMTCEGCENTVKAAVEKVEGVYSATATHAEAYAIAAYDAGTPDTAAIREAITTSGYKVTGFKFLGHELPKKE
jgi:copper chaperone CopZ